MKVTKTDRLSSLNASEYVWDTNDSAEAHDYVWPALAARVSELAANSILDIGCGNGALTVRLKDLAGRCVGTDFSESGIKIAQQRSAAVEFIRSCVSDALPDNLHTSFDAVVAVEVVEHLLLPRQLFARAREALRPGGYLLVTTPYHGYWKNCALAACGMFDSHCHPLRDYGHIKFFSIQTLTALFEEQGFKVDYVARVGRVPMFARSMIIGGVMRGIR